MPSLVTCFLNVSITKVEIYFQKIKGEHNMEFKLNEYHRNISDEEFVRDILISKTVNASSFWKEMV